MITCNKCGKMYAKVADIPKGGCCNTNKKEITITFKDEPSLNGCNGCIFENDYKDSDCMFVENTLVKLGFPHCDEGIVYIVKE